MPSCGCCMRPAASPVVGGPAPVDATPQPVDATAQPAPADATPQPAPVEVAPPPAAAGTSDHDQAFANLAAAHDFFARYGLGAEHGNGPIDVVIDYGPESFTAYLPDTDRIQVARNPISGQGEAGARDVLVHEYTHRILDRLVPGLSDASGEAAAVNESLADTIATAVDTDDWTIGEDVIDGGGRSLETGAQIDKVAGQYQLIAKPTHMSQFERTDRDNGGAHINMGIPSRAAFLIGTQLGRQSMADIYMNAVTRGYVAASTTFLGLAQASVRSASELYGTGSAQSLAVQQAWQAVGVLA